MSRNQNRAKLYMDDSTNAEDVLAFAAERTANPTVLRDGDVIIFNYNNDPLEPQPLFEWAEDASPGVYLHSYNIPAVWAFIQRALPKAVRDGDVLAYRSTGDEYVAHENWRRSLVDTEEEFENPQSVRGKLDLIHHAATEVMDDV